MKTIILVSKQLYDNYNEDILKLDVRCFTNEYFYNLNNYKLPIELENIKNYLLFNESIEILSMSSFVDFINILLVLSFLKDNNYQGKIEIKYYTLNKKTLNDALICKASFNDYENVNIILNSIKDKKTVTSKIALPGFINFINFYNLLINRELFLETVADEIELYGSNIDYLANILYEKYFSMGLSKEFYVKYLEDK